MFIEAVPRYSQINLFQENGKPEKRKQFFKRAKNRSIAKTGKGQSKGKETAESQGMGV